MGKRLTGAGALHVVCWQSEMQDDTAREFALQFYASLNEQTRRTKGTKGLPTRVPALLRTRRTKGTTDTHSCSLPLPLALVVVPRVHPRSTLLPVQWTACACSARVSTGFQTQGTVRQGQDSDSCNFKSPQTQVGTVGHAQHCHITFCLANPASPDPFRFCMGRVSKPN